jgi:hypothetical protein
LRLVRSLSCSFFRPLSSPTFPPSGEYLCSIRPSVTSHGPLFPQPRLKYLSTTRTEKKRMRWTPKGFKHSAIYIPVCIYTPPLSNLPFPRPSASRRERIMEPRNFTSTSDLLVSPHESLQHPAQCNNTLTRRLCFVTTRVGA